MRKRVIQDMESGEVLDDLNFDANRGMANLPLDALWRELDGPKDIIVYLWYYSANGESMINEEISMVKDMAGMQPWRVGDAPVQEGRASSSSSGAMGSGGGGGAYRDPPPGRGDPRGAPPEQPPRGNHAALAPNGVMVPKPLPIARIDRAILAKLQSECTEFGPYYCYHK